MKKKIILYLVLLSLIGTIFVFTIYNNTSCLFNIAEGLDEPSFLFYTVVERIYSLSTNKKANSRLLKYVENSKNSHLQNLYIRTIGIIGGDTTLANHLLIKEYIKHQNNAKKKSLILTVIDSMGFIGDQISANILKQILANYDKHEVLIPKYSIARALYLITGQSVNYSSKNGEKIKFFETDELRRAREAIINSRGRYRTIEEMLILDYLNRPDHYKTELMVE